MSGSVGIPGGAGPPRAKMAANAVTDPSQAMEEFCINAKNLPVEIKRSFNLIGTLDQRVSELKNKVDEDSNTYSSAKNRNSTEMVELKRQIDEDQKQCLHLSVEKVSHAQGCLDMIQQRLKQLDEEIATIDEFMLSQPQQGGDDEDEGAGGTSRGGAGSSRKRKAQSIEDWLVVGKFVEVNWEEDWWQASIKQIKQKQGGAMSGGGMRGPPVSVLVSYVGGDEGEDEWIQVASGRLRPPSDTFHEAPAPEYEDQQMHSPMVATPHARGGGAYGFAGNRFM